VCCFLAVSDFLTVDGFIIVNLCRKVPNVGNTLSSVVYAQHRIGCIDNDDT
jgi:hypothetical protein